MNVLRSRRLLVPAWVLAAALAGLAADDATPSPHFELFIGGGPSLASGTASYANAYDPHPGYKIPGSYARQTLTVDPGAGGCLTMGGTLFLGRAFGVRLSFLADDRAIGGENAPYDYYYLYTAVRPPDYTPTDTSYARQVAWPSSEGRLREYGGRLEAVWRCPASASFEVAFTAGLSLTSTRGRLHPLGLSEQWEGSHGVLFINDYLVYLRLPPRILAGGALGVEAAVRLSDHVWLRLEGSVRKSGAYEAVPEIDKILDYYSLDEAGEDAWALAEDRFDLKPLRLSLSRAAFGAVLVVRL